MIPEAYVLARQGLDTLAMIVDEAARIRPGSVIADLKIARGLDYYTGSVYETFLDGAAALGSICSGGRYDNLASQGNRKYPGVGLSIGLSRLVSYMLHTAGAHANRVSPASVLVAVWNEEDRSASNQIANQLRARGIAADVAPTAAKLGKPDQVCRQARHPIRVVPRGQVRAGRFGRSQEHHHGRPAAGQRTVLGAGYCVCPANRYRRSLKSQDFNH